MKIPIQPLLPKCYGDEVTLVGCVHWSHLLEDWAGLRESDLISAIEQLQISAYKYRECRQNRDGSLLAKASRVRPYCIWQIRPKEEQDDRLEGSEPPKDIIIIKSFSEIFVPDNVVFRKEDIAMLEARYPEWKLPLFDPAGSRAKKDRLNEPLKEVEKESPEEMVKRLQAEIEDMNPRERKLFLTRKLDAAFPSITLAKLGKLIRQKGEFDNHEANKQRGKVYRARLKKSL